MNYVAASLLLVMKNEEEAFWMLAVLLENILLHDSYSENLYGCHVEQRVFKDLFRKKCPRYLLARLTFMILCYVHRRIGTKFIVFFIKLNICICKRISMETQCRLCLLV